MRRALLRIVLVVLVVPILPAPARAGPPPVPATSDRVELHVRGRGEAEWRLYGACTREAAVSVAAHLQRMGYELRTVPARTAVERPVSPPLPGNLPVAQTVTPAQAQSAFRLLATRDDICYRFPADGCYARTYLMMRQLN